MGRIIGIDLGTTNSVMAVWDGREPRILVNRDGARLTPSVVGFSSSGEVFVGQTARRQAVTNPESTISSVKRFIGQTFRDARIDADLVSYGIAEGDGGEALIVVDEKRCSPAEISAHILRELKWAAEDFLGEIVEGAVITVPAYFNDAQRTATKEAGRLAGLDVRRIINEPTAAALAYGLDKSREELVAVYDFGGGTFDVSILSVADDVIEVISTHGDTHLGGDDIDVRVAAWLLDQFRRQFGIELDADVTALQRLREAAEQAKIDLSTRSETEIKLPFLAASSGSPLHLNAILTREVFEGMIADLIDRTLLSCNQALADAGKSASRIDEVVLVGGSSRVPLVQQRVTEFFNRDPRRTVNPDEVVALGAAVQAGVLSGEIKGLVLLDVTSLSLGVQTYDGATAVVVPRNTTIPTDGTRTFSTAVDGQTTVEIHVLQGESSVARENDSLGRFDLDGIEPAPAGVAQIEVKFSIDLNGMVEVTARDRATGRSQRVSVVTRMRTGDEGKPSELPEKGQAVEATGDRHSRRSATRTETPKPGGWAASPGPAGTPRPSSTPEVADWTSRDANAAGGQSAPSRSSKGKSDSSQGPEPAKDSDENSPDEDTSKPGLSPSAQAAIREAERVLRQFADKIPGNEVARLEGFVSHLRKLAAEGSGPGELDRARSSLLQATGVVTNSVLLRKPQHGAR